mgnify:CR=1 FL=1
MVNLSSQVLRQIQLHGEIIGPNILVAEYQLLSANVVSEVEGTLVLWGAAEPLWLDEPLKCYPLVDRLIYGECLLNGIKLSETHYTVGLKVGKVPQAIGSILSFCPGNSQGQNTSINLQLQEFGVDSLIVTVSGLLGNIPRRYQNWLGLWEGDPPLYKKEGCICRVAVNSLQSTFTQQLRGIPLKFNSLYTIAYGVGPNWENVAATLTFKTEPY